MDIRDVKVGMRVRNKPDGDTGTVTKIDKKIVWVSWELNDHGEELWTAADHLEPIEDADNDLNETASCIMDAMAHIENARGEQRKDSPVLESLRKCWIEVVFLQTGKYPNKEKS